MANMGIQEIEGKVEEVRHNLNAEYQRGAMRDEAKISNLTQQLNDLTQQLEVEQRLVQHEARVEESQAQIAYMMDTLTVQGMSMREVFQNNTEETAEAAYQLVRSSIQDKIMEHDEDRLSEINELKSQLASTKADKDSLQKLHDDLYEASAQQRNELNLVKAELEDTQRKRDAASAELGEAQKEVARLNSQVDDLRQEIAVGASNSLKVVSVNTEDAMETYKKLKQKEEDSKPAIYDLQQADTKGSVYTAKLAATDEEIKFNWMEKGKYREVTAAEAETFRREAEEKRSHENTAQPGDGVAQDHVTPTEDTPTNGDGVDEGNPNGEVAAKTVEERLEALERAVFRGVKGEAA